MLTDKKMTWVTLFPQVLTGGRHTLQQGGASLLCSLPDRWLLDALWRPEEWQSDPVAQATRAPAAVLPGLHPFLRQVNSSNLKWIRRWAASSQVKEFIHPFLIFFFVWYIALPVVLALSWGYKFHLFDLDFKFDRKHWKTKRVMQATNAPGWTQTWDIMDACHAAELKGNFFLFYSQENKTHSRF